MKSIRIALAQINTIVGDITGNSKKIISYIKKAQEEKADIVVFPEMAITGYPPEDLLLKPQFIKDNLEAISDIANFVEDIIAIVGFVDRDTDIYNAAAIIYNHNIVDVYHKIFLPNYGVFDEMRYFQSGSKIPVYKIGNIMVGINICEDIWYPNGPHRLQTLAGAEIIININASPYHIGKPFHRERMLSTRASDSISILCYINMVGGQDELVFDGCSMIFDEKGSLLYIGNQFKEDFILFDLNIEAVFMKRLHDPKRRQEIQRTQTEFVNYISIDKTIKTKKTKMLKKKKRLLEEIEEVYSALVLGTKDYVDKNGFSAVLIGLSGGIDSSLVATIATDALGKHRVNAVFMPSPYTSKESKEDAIILAENLGITLFTIPIDKIFQAYIDTLKKYFADKKTDVTEENIQARIRGNILMALSNKFGWLVLTTGNKSEMSVGYATLYGDMAGGFAVIKDVPKTMVYKLAKWRNEKEGKFLIPKRILLKEPSAELKPQQKDTDTLPPYEMLDPILKAYIEEDRSFTEILEFNSCDIECTKKVINMIDKSEYKRRQSPPGIKITNRAFGRDRRFPITNKYKSY